MESPIRYWIPILIGGVTVVAAIIGGVVLKLVFKKEPQKIALQGQSIKISVRLLDKEAISHDTYMYTFALPSPEHILGLPIGNCVRLHARINGENVVRPYTPISKEKEEGYVKFVIKIYRKDTSDKFPLGGKMTQYLESLTKDSCVDMSGPFGKFVYIGNGVFNVQKESETQINVKRVSLICGGSGIAPIYQLCRAILTSDSDNTKITLLFANKTDKDILLRDELEAFRDKYPNQFRLWYTVDTAPKEWPYSTGFVDQRMLEEHIFPSGEENLALMCGPPAMISSACMPSLQAIGYTDNRILKY